MNPIKESVEKNIYIMGCVKTEKIDYAPKVHQNGLDAWC